MTVPATILQGTYAFQSNCAVLQRYPNGSSKVTERYFEGTVTALQRYRNGTSRVTKRYGTVLQRYYDGSTFTVTGTFVDVFLARTVHVHEHVHTYIPMYDTCVNAILQCS